MWSWIFALVAWIAVGCFAWWVKAERKGKEYYKRLYTNESTEYYSWQDYSCKILSVFMPLENALRKYGFFPTGRTDEFRPGFVEMRLTDCRASGIYLRLKVSFSTSGMGSSQYLITLGLTFPSTNDGDSWAILKNRIRERSETRLDGLKTAYSLRDIEGEGLNPLEVANQIIAAVEFYEKAMKKVAAESVALGRQDVQVFEAEKEVRTCHAEREAIIRRILDELDPPPAQEKVAS